AADLMYRWAAALAAKGFKAIPVVVSTTESPDEAATKVAVLQVDRVVVLTVDDWRTDTRTDNKFKTQLFYDLDLQVRDSVGKVLAQRRLSGHEGGVSGAARDAFRQKLEMVLNSPA